MRAVAPVRKAVASGTVLAFLVAGQALAAESTPSRQPIARFEGLVEVSEVFLDVLVNDAEGHAVSGLGIDDFEVLEDGEPVAITSVDYYATRYELGVDEATGDEVPASRYFLVFLDDQTRHGYYGRELLRQQLRAAADLATWIREAMAPSDWMAVASHDGTLRIHHDFTQDREALVAAVEDAAGGRSPGPFGRSRGGSARPFTLGILDRLPRGAELRRASSDVHDALRLLAEACGYLVGRKNLLLYTVGFGREVGHGRAVVPEPGEYPELESALNDHNLAVYPIDLTPAGRPPRQPDFLARLAVDTGGVYDPDFVGFRSPVERIAAENAGYYLLSYETQHPAGEIGYQRVEVRAGGGLTVKARRGYRYGL